MNESLACSSASLVSEPLVIREDSAGPLMSDKESSTQSSPGQDSLDRDCSGPTKRLRAKSVMVISIGVGLAFIVFIVFLAMSPPQSQRHLFSPLVGKPAPALSGTTITGVPFSLGSFSGHFVFVDFFASWCPACVTEQPQLNAFVREQNHTNGARLVGVIFGDRVSNIRSFLGKEVGKYPVLPDPTGTFALHWGVGNAAEMYFVSPKGQILAKIDGGVTLKELDTLIARAQSTNG